MRVDVVQAQIYADLVSDSVGSGYGFPSSHSQYMGYFATFLMMHLYFRHRFTSTGHKLLDRLWRFVVYVGLISWAATVCYSRCVTKGPTYESTRTEYCMKRRLYLTYHTVAQVLWGAGAGVAFGAFTYTIAELIPSLRPNSSLGRFRSSILAHPIATWLRLRDGWAVWADGGRETEWQAWRVQWEKQRLAAASKSKAKKSS